MAKLNFRESALDDKDDDLYDQAVETVRSAGEASALLLQRRHKIGYARAVRLLDLMEERRVVGPGGRDEPRKVIGVTDPIAEGIATLLDKFLNALGWILKVVLVIVFIVVCLWALKIFLIWLLGR